MFKKNKVAIISLAILLIVACIVFLKNKNFTLEKNEANFSISDTSVITKIKVSNGDSSFTLTKNHSNWLYNNSIAANSELLNIIFRIFTQVEIKSAVSKVSSAQIIEKIKKDGSVVQVYSNNKVKKQFRIFADPSRQCVFMLMQNSKKPYEVSLPSFKGNFAGVFKAPRRLWHNRSIFTMFARNIGSVKVVHYANNEKSFELIFNEKGQSTLKSSKNIEIQNISKESVDAYLYCIKKFRVETFIENSDSLIKIFSTQKPSHNVVISDISGAQCSFDLYPIENKSTGSKTVNNQLSMNYCYLFINKKEVAIAKYIETDPITRDIIFFTK